MRGGATCDVVAPEGLPGHASVALGPRSRAMRLAGAVNVVPFNSRTNRSSSAFMFVAGKYMRVVCRHGIA